MSNKQYKNLVTNSLVFTIANLGSKVISFIMVPLYTYVLTKEEYGTVDLMTTFNSLLIPVLFLCASDAVLRYCMDKRYNSKEVLSNSFFIYIWGIGLLCLIVPALGKFYPDIAPYGVCLGMLLFSNGLMQVSNQYSTGYRAYKGICCEWNYIYICICIIKHFIFGKTPIRYKWISI